MSRMRKAERSFTGTPAENRAIQAGIRATNAALNQGKSRVEAKKIGADAADKAMKGSRSKFNRRFTMLAASAIGGGGLALAGRGLGAAGKALVKTLRSQKGASKKAKELAQTRGKRSRAQLDRPKTKPTSQDAGTLRRAKEALDKTSPKVKKSKTLRAKEKLEKSVAKSRKTGANVQITPKKIGPTKGDVARTAITIGGATGVGALEGLRKKNMAKAAESNIPTPKRKPKPPKRATESIPAGGFDAGAMKPKAKAKPKAKPKDEAMSMGEYLEGAVGMRGAKGLEGAKRKVKTPFGTLTFDTSDDAFEPDVENKAGGRIKRQAGGKVRGVGQAIKGFGKATYSDKMF